MQLNFYAGSTLSICLKEELSIPEINFTRTKVTPRIRSSPMVCVLSGSQDSDNTTGWVFIQLNHCGAEENSRCLLFFTDTVIMIDSPTEKVFQSQDYTVSERDVS